MVSHRDELVLRIEIAKRQCSQRAPSLRCSTNQCVCCFYLVRERVAVRMLDTLDRIRSWVQNSNKKQESGLDCNSRFVIAFFLIHIYLSLEYRAYKRL